MADEPEIAVHQKLLDERAMLTHKRVEAQRILDAEHQASLADLQRRCESAGHLWPGKSLVDRCVVCRAGQSR